MSDLSNIRINRLFFGLVPTRNSARKPGLMGYLALYRQRRALARMDAAQLDDLGLTREEAMIEASRPVWDAPHHWMGS